MDFIKKEIWENYWCFTPKESINFSILGNLDYVVWYKDEKSPLETLIDIVDGSNKPTDKQIETLNFIQENQDAILDSIFLYYKTVLLPVFQEATDIAEDEIASDKTKLSKVLGLTSIEIPNILDTEPNHFLLKFDFNYDAEHGLYILFIENKVIDSFEEGDKDDVAVQLFTNGIKNNDGSPIDIGIYELNGKTVYKGSHKDDEIICENFKKGTYRTFFGFNQTEKCIIFFVKEDVDSFKFNDLIFQK